jgi:hypothetical protein
MIDGWRDGLTAKFRGCVAAAGRELPAANADGLVRFVRSLEGTDDVRKLLGYAVF